MRDEFAVRFVAGVDPDHDHWLVAVVEKTMRAARGDADGVHVGNVVLRPGDLTNRDAFDNGDRFVVNVRVAWKAHVGWKQTIPAANPARTKSLGEQVSRLDTFAYLICLRFRKPNERLGAVVPRRLAFDLAKVVVYKVAFNRFCWEGGM